MGDFSDSDIIEELKPMRRRNFFGELLVKVLGGKVTAIKVSQMKKPADNPRTE